MSRRRHGRTQHHGQGPAVGPRPATGPRPDPNPGSEASASGAIVARTQRPQGPAPLRGSEPAPQTRPIPPAAPPEDDIAAPATTGPVPTAVAIAPPIPITANATAPGPFGGGPDRNGQCTAPQLRRFIKSRPYVPMHELRRRFGIDGGDDDVTPVRLEPGWVYVGLPAREGTLLGELLRAGEIGYELSLDPRSPVVIGVYPMRPIIRG